MDRPSSETPFHFARPPRPPRPSRPSRLSRPPRPPSSHPYTSSRRRPRASQPYIPPFRQKRLDATSVADAPITTSSEPGQRRAWIAMKKQINGIINMVNMDNVAFCAKALFRLNLIRARAVLVKTMLRAQLASPDLSPVFACLISVIGSRLPQVTELLVARLIAQLKAAYKNQDRSLCFATARFMAHLFNQQVVTDLLLLEFLSTCMLDPSDGSIELAVVTLRDCAVLLSEKSPRALELVFQRLREVLHDGDLSRRVQVMIENLISMRRENFANANVLDPRLDLLADEDIITHLASLEDEEIPDLQYDCDNFQYDANYDEHERTYEDIKRIILGAEADCPIVIPSQSEVSDEKAQQPKQIENNPGAGGPSDAKHDDHGKSKEKIKDMTDAQLVDFRRAVYLTIGSGLSYEEWAHKLVHLMRKHKGRELQLCEMIIECCRQEKTYLRSYGLLGQRFCLLSRVYVSKFEELFATHYASIHKFDSRKIRNMANFYASLFATDALPWVTFQLVRIVEKETTTSSRIFLKYLFQEIANTLGHGLTKERFARAVAAGHMNAVFPTDTAENARFAITFFSSIKLKFVTDDLREKLKSIPKTITEGDGGDSSAQESSSLSSSSLSSSSLSESSGLEDSLGGGRRGRHSSGSKRAAEDSPLEESERPVKTRRGNGGDAESEDFGGSGVERRVITGRWSPHGRSVGRGGGDEREEDRHGRSYMGYHRIGNDGISDEEGGGGGRRDLSRERRSPREDERRRRKERKERYRRRRYDDSEDSDLDGDYGADRRRQRHERREGSRSERVRRRRRSAERGSRRRSHGRSDSDSPSGRDGGRRYRDRGEYWDERRRDDYEDDRYGRRGGGGGGSSGSRKYVSRSRRRNFSEDSSDERLSSRARSVSPRRYGDSDYDDVDDGYGRRRRAVSRDRA